MRALIGTSELAELLASENPPVLLDVRWRLVGQPGASSYAESHLPAARFVDLDTALAGAPGDGGRHPLPDPEVFGEAMRSAGVRSGRPVVVYDDADGSVAARAWWLLRWSGHQEVAVLDGGYAAWVAEDRPVTAAIPEPVEGDFQPEPGQLPVLDADEARDIAAQGVLLDARAHERYAGEVEPVDPRAGHIPGAVNAPFSGHIGPDGRWLEPGALAERFAGLGVAEGVPVGAYCGSGVTASSVVLALELAGTPGAALYAGSWSHWCRDPRRPVATGGNPGAPQ